MKGLRLHKLLLWGTSCFATKTTLKTVEDQELGRRRPIESYSSPMMRIKIPSPNRTSIFDKYKRNKQYKKSSPIFRLSFKLQNIQIHNITKYKDDKK
ncbi:hypothetical protein CDAR_478961 [Caerostris darwini]|uniref:Secreted protein n=1 Tax=Caerostris darwini TaxID=1538125 RepID=A0AAV4RTN9_9ARAC|nr:hypothetical protein CDAR_478961 [Caerostris darwini]